MKDRTVERTQGCWNCIHGHSAVPFWSDQRQGNLAKAVQIAQESLLGEEDQRVINIRRMVHTADIHVARHELLRCTRGKTASNEPIGDLVAHNFLCSIWSGRVGASVARAGGAPDKLPEELMHDLDGSQPQSLTQLAQGLDTAKD